jgi:hypothetical protein
MCNDKYKTSIKEIFEPQTFEYSPESNDNSDFNKNHIIQSIYLR